MTSASPAPLPRRQFGSDNYSGICPEAWEALQRANHGHAQAYGDDPWTQRAADLIRELFETDCEVFFTFNGTAANSLALASLCQSYHSIICSNLAHVETDECGAPEFYSNGTKILLVQEDCGKVPPEAIWQVVNKRQDIHYPKPRALSVTQATECGTVYSVSEIAAVCQAAKDCGLSVHMDGARFANAMATLDVAPKEVTWQAGVDVLCFGGSKMGAPLGEMVIFFERQLAEDFAYRCKQAGQLASKMRFMAAPWVGLLTDGAWLRHARHANAMAQLLTDGIAAIDGLQLLYPRQANSVFVSLNPAVEQGLRERGWLFYTFIGQGGARLMCSWDTCSSDVQAFLSDLKELA